MISSTPRPISDIKADIQENAVRAAALKVEIANLDAALKAARRELDHRTADWNGTLANRLKNELSYAERYEDNRRHPQIPTAPDEGQWFVISLSKKQARIRDDRGNEWIVRSGSGRYVATLETCRAAWVAAGRELP